MKLVIRQATTSELRLIYSAWLHSVWDTYARHQGVKRGRFSAGYRQLQLQIIPKAELRVATFAEVPEEVLGFSVARKEHLVFVYVKHAFRRQGIGTALTPPHIQTFSQLTGETGKAFTDKLKLEYDPYAIFGLTGGSV